MQTYFLVEIVLDMHLGIQDIPGDCRSRVTHYRVDVRILIDNIKSHWEYHVYSIMAKSRHLDPPDTGNVRQNNHGADDTTYNHGANDTTPSVVHTR